MAPRGPVQAGKRAEKRGSLFLAYDVGEVGPNGNTLRIGGGVRAVGERAGINDNSYNLPGYAVFDAFATYTLQLEKPVTLQLNLKTFSTRPIIPRPSAPPAMPMP